MSERFSPAVDLLLRDVGAVLLPETPRAAEPLLEKEALDVLLDLVGAEAGARARTAGPSKPFP